MLSDEGSLWPRRGAPAEEPTARKGTDELAKGESEATKRRIILSLSPKAG